MTNLIFSETERTIAIRYIKSRRVEGFISISAWFSLIGIILGVAKDGSLILSHVYDNRELDLDSADKVKDDLSKLWDGQVKLFTIIEGEQWEI